MKRFVIVLAFFLVAIPEIIVAQDFNFYGVRFGMPRTEVEKVFKIDSQYGANQIENPGHGMDLLYAGFDHKDRLFYVEVYYNLERSEKNEALTLALKERFEDPIKRLHKDIEITTDTYTNVGRYGESKSLVMKLVSKRLRTEYVNSLKMQLLELMK